MALEDYFPWDKREARSPVIATCDFEDVGNPTATKVRRLVAISNDGTRHLDSELYDKPGIAKRAKSFAETLAGRKYTVNIDWSEINSSEPPV